MTTKQHEQAYKEAEKELVQEQIDEIKDYIKKILQKIEDEKGKKEEAEDNIRLLKLDLEDLRQGKLEKIKERHDKSTKNLVPLTTGYSKLLEVATVSNSPNSLIYGTATNVNWSDATSGTYKVTSATGVAKEYYF